MGKGDKRTARGKIFKGSYGNSRPQRANSSGAAKAGAAKKTAKKS
jgi:30S ribosomal protein S31